IPGSKPAFEIRCPHLIGFLWHGQDCSGQLRSSPSDSSPGSYPSQASQPFGDGPYLGQVAAPMLAAQLCIYLLGAPTPMALAHLLNLFQPASGGPSGRVVGTP